MNGRGCDVGRALDEWDGIREMRGAGTRNDWV